MRKENPGMSAVSGARPFDRDGDAIATARVGEGPNIPPPLSFVEIRSEKPAAIVREHWINAHNEGRPVRTGPTEMAFDGCDIDADECLIWADRAFDLGFFADAAPPFIRAGGRIAAAPGFRVLPPKGKHLRASPE